MTKLTTEALDALDAATNKSTPGPTFSSRSKVPPSHKLSRALGEILYGDSNSTISIEINGEGGHSTAYIDICQDNLVDDKVANHFLSLEDSLNNLARADRKHTEFFQARLQETVYDICHDRLLVLTHRLGQIFHQNPKVVQDITCQTLNLQEENTSVLSNEFVRILLEIHHHIIELKNATGVKITLRHIANKGYSCFHLRGVETSLRTISHDDVAYEKINQLLVELSRLAGACKSIAEITPFAKRYTIRLINQLSKNQNNSVLVHTLPTFRTPCPNFTNQPLFKKSEQQTRSKKRNLGFITPAAHGINPIISLAQPFLEPQDRGLDFSCLKPVSKQLAMILLGYVLQKKHPPPVSDAFLAFGYVTCSFANAARDEPYLSRMFVRIFTSCGDKEETKTLTFRRFWEAFEHNRLGEFLGEYHDYQSLFPYLNDFLNTPPQARLSIWELKWFLRMDGYDPPMKICIDFGFINCKQRDQVEILKTLYQRMLTKISPMKLQHASEENSLYELATTLGIDMLPTYTRLLKLR